MVVISRELSHAKAVSAIIILWLTTASAADSEFRVVLPGVIYICIHWESLTLFDMFTLLFNFINLVILMCITLDENSPNSDKLILMTSLLCLFIVVIYCNIGSQCE